MKKIKIVLLSLVFSAALLVPITAWPQVPQGASDLPQVAQPLVREGDLAVKLVESLKIGTAEDEAEAESMLVIVEIEPRNGWISDYPVTPDVIGELQNSIVNAADSGKLTITKDRAVQEFESLCASLGLPVAAVKSGINSEGEPAVETSQYDSPAVVDNYYYEYGPPVITYYAPPWDYYYLYTWVPYPFWYGRFYFAGFFCLHNFSKIVVVNNRHKIVTNGVFNRRVHRTVWIDPSTRSAGRTAMTGRIAPSAGLTSNEARRGAQSILARSVERPVVSRAATSSGNAGLGGPILSSPHIDRGLEQVAPSREVGRLPESEGRDFGSQATANRGESLRRHDSASHQEVRGGTSSFGNHGSSADLAGGGRNSFRNETSGRESRFSIGNSVGTSPSGEIRGGGREGAFHGAGRSASSGRGGCVGRC